MKKNYYLLLMLCVMLCVLLLSYNREVKKGELLEIPVDIDQNFSLPLSEITDEIIAIEPELTDESLVNPDRIQSVLLVEDDVIIAELDKILVFHRDGKFVRAIGSRGQGPGEFTGIQNIALDKKNKCLYVIALPRKIICYDLMTGKYIKESPQMPQIGTLKDVNYINDELLLLSDQSEPDKKGHFKLSALYHVNNAFQITDSMIIRKNYFEQQTFRANSRDRAIILSGNSNLYVYCPEIYPGRSSPFQANPSETVLRDTLYRFEHNHLIPELKLKFKNDGIDAGGKFIDIYSIYRSSRYIFAYYGNLLNTTSYHFCYDTETGKGYTMQDGFTDDVNNIEKRIDIRPVGLNTEIFYYWHTNMRPGDREEPNPTIYIGKLKK